MLTTTYSYDDASRLDVVTDPNGLTYDHEYDPNGNRASLSYPNGTDTAYTFDDLNRLTDLTTTGPSGVIQSYQFTLGPSGNRTQIDEADGTRRAYEYDDLYRLTLETVTDTLGLVYQKSFVYDDVGNRLNQTTTGQGAAVIDYTYDTRDRLLTENATTYGYDANGNLTSKSGEATYVWDFEDRLIRVEKTDGTVVTHAYDADGNRVRTEVTPSTGPPQVTNFLVDPAGSLSHVVAETDASGAFLTYYVRSNDELLSLIRAGQQRFYHADGLGSVRRLSDEGGTVTDSYTYSAFGELLAHTGSDPQRYTFAGEPFDPNIGFYYNRARWLDPRVGRFASVDPLESLELEPGTLHRYLYASADPVGRRDPSGQQVIGVAGALAVIGMIATISAIALPRFGGVAGEKATLYLRLFAPWLFFGVYFRGDARGFSTSTSPSVTSRIQGRVTFEIGTDAIYSFDAWSDPSHDVFGRTDTGHPTISVRSTSRGITMELAGNNPLVPGSPDIDATLNFSATLGGNRQVCFAGKLEGDAFPNAEVFVIRKGVRTLLLTFKTAGGQETGPAVYLPGKNARPMGSFRKCW